LLKHVHYSGSTNITQKCVFPLEDSISDHFEFRPVSTVATTRSITRCPHPAQETSCTWRSTVTLEFPASGCLNWARPGSFDASRASRETPVTKSALPENGELTALHAVTVVKALAIHSQASARKGVQSAGWEETVKRRRRTVMQEHLLSVHPTPSLSRTTTGVASHYRDASVCQDSLATDIKTVMLNFAFSYHSLQQAQNISTVMRLR
ncbi:hypothetical protein ANCCAN_18620, partial [Ancylostoma caninum]